MWFITTLAEELGIDVGIRWSVISDQQKGLVAALKTVMPQAEHKKCARHVSANWKAKHTSDAARMVFWNCVYSCNERDFLEHYKELEVKEFDKGFVVHLMDRTCTCGYYTLFGIPCTHAVAAIAYMRLNVDEFVHKLYHTEKVAAIYRYGLPALVGRQHWPYTYGLIVLPPPGKRMPGRPKVARRKELAELKGQPRRQGPGTCLGRQGNLIVCRRCKQPGHNARSCAFVP
ncbi:hypothetical protein LINGRAHAP2_LOCUS24124 [Linum grandiflorum]